MAERHVRAVQKYSAIKEDDVRHVMEVIALDIGRDDSPAHTSLRKIAERVRRSVNKVRDLIQLAVDSGELIRMEEGKYHVYSLNQERIPCGRTPKRENHGKFGPELRPATLLDLKELEERLSEHNTELYQKLYHEIVLIVSRLVEGRDTKDIVKNSSNDDHDINKRIISHFCRETGITPDGETFNDDWLPVVDQWRTMYGEEGAKARITQSVKFARGDNDRGKRYIISNPSSLVTINANLPSDNGRGGAVKVGSR